MSARKWETTLASGRAVVLWVAEQDGQPVKVSVEAGKIGDQFSAWLSCLCALVSIGLKSGRVPLSAYVHGLRRKAGDEGSEAVDWIARTLGEAYGG